jgi:CRISPR/Cas system-associated endoribonuclease Cas2
MSAAPATALVEHREGAKASRRSESRRQSALFAMRMTETDRRRLDEAAREAGFKDAKELVLHRLRRDLKPTAR